jgi:hypothetical protein
MTSILDNLRDFAQRIEAMATDALAALGPWLAPIPSAALGDWVDLAPVGPALGDVERALVAYALQELNSAFKVNALAEAHKGTISGRQIRKLAKQWEQRGWLTTPEHATDARKVTPELEALALDVKSERTDIGNIGGHRGSI